MIRYSLRNQIVLWACAYLLISNLSGIVFSAYTLNRQAESARSAAVTAGEEKATTSAQTIASVYIGEMNAALLVSRAVEKSVSIGSADASASTTLSRDQVTAMLKNVLSDHPGFLDIYTDWLPNAFDGKDSQFIGTDTADMDGRFIPWWARQGGVLQLQPTTGNYQDEASQDYFRLPMESRQETLIEPYSDTIDNQAILMTSLIVPIVSNDKFLGICGIDIALSELQSQVDRYAASLYGGTAEIEIVSASGRVVAHSGKPDWAGKALQEVDPVDEQVILAAMKSGQSKATHLSGMVQAFAQIQPGSTTTPWIVMLSVPEAKITQQADAAFSEVKTSMIIMIVLALAGNFLGLFILWLFARAFTRPIQVAAGFLGTMVDGDVSQDLPQKLLERQDELGSLTQSVQSMAESLRLIFTELVRSAETLGDSSTHLLSVSERTSVRASLSLNQANTVAAAADELSANTTSVAAGVDQVTIQLDTIAGSTHELVSAAGEIAANSERARATTQEASGQADRVSGMMQEMGRAATEIGKITETITQISSQTNLLALNATIEAARAGAVGKGFTVVANEIKDLARRTTIATTEVKDQIANMQASTTGAVGEIDKIVGLIRRIHDSVNMIAVAIDEHTTVTRDIAENIVQASSGLREANQRVGETASVSHTISEEINGVRLTAEEMSQESQQLQGRAAELSHLAVELRKLIAKYKV